MNKLYALKKGSWEGLFVLQNKKDCYGFLEKETGETVLLQGTKQKQGYEFLIDEEEQAYHFLANRGIGELYAKEGFTQPELVITPMAYYFRSEEEQELSKQVLDKFFSSIASFMDNGDLIFPEQELKVVKSRQ